MSSIDRFSNMIKPYSRTAAEQIKLDQRQNWVASGHSKVSRWQIWGTHGGLIRSGALETVARPVILPFVALYQLCTGEFKKAGYTLAARCIAGTAVSAIATVAAVLRFLIIYPIIGGFNLPTGVEMASNTAGQLANYFSGSQSTQDDR